MTEPNWVISSDLIGRQHIYRTLRSIAAVYRTGLSTALEPCNSVAQKQFRDLNHSLRTACKSIERASTIPS